MAEKDGMAIMLGIGKKKPMGDDMAEGSPEQDAIQEFFEAGKRGDYAAATDAFRTAYDLCASGGGDDEADEESAESEF